MTENATSATISAERNLELVADAVAFEPPCFSASDRSRRDAWRAGTSPKHAVEISDNANANTTTVVSIRTSPMRGRSAGENATIP